MPKKSVSVPTARQLPSGQWFCRVRVRGQDICITRPTEREAVAEAMAVKAGILKDPKPKVEKTLRQCIDEYIRERENILSPATIAGYRVIQRNRMKLLMDKPLSRITERQIRAAVNQDAAEVSPKTVKNAYGLLASVLQDHGSTVDMSHIRMPQSQRKEKQIYNREDLMRLIEALRGTDIEAPILLAVMLGLRRSEICALTWDCVDIKNRTVRIESAVVYDENNDAIHKGTKTAGSARTLGNCPEYLMAVLDALPRDGDLVCNMTPNVLSHRFKRFLDANDLPHIGLHNLRHTNASILLALNVPDKYAMQLGGWTSSDTMKRIYQHLMDDELLEATTRRNEFFSALLPSKKRTGKYRIIRLVRYPEDLKKK